MKLLKRTLILLVLTLTAGSFSLVWADQPQSHMTIYAGVPGADQMLEGDYIGAIDELLNARAENPALLFNNLCVAYILAKQTQQARESCDRAQRETERRRNYGETWLERKYARRTKKLYRERANHHLTVLDSVEQLLAEAGRR